ncbi:hypothetical protein H9M94_01110 [Mycoplasma sp. Pen4]|uniref:Mbov_0399 family ICE element protein n=1 Tax=Mycoplasma sp. Pen4 TaxID=640330 RepID=UPI001653FF9C|nr:hypothetical protein [Mycoplasma sp. Pen4]QNM93762.1 hypothetical protein H9M94_00595 [Mycoplasma sp. Pen4]QNM93858.1 hypothetical protein H9M94_01110 [Mycoplasma sp. Pen4]
MKLLNLNKKKILTTLLLGGTLVVPLTTISATLWRQDRDGDDEAYKFSTYYYLDSEHLSRNLYYVGDSAPSYDKFDKWRYNGFSRENFNYELNKDLNELDYRILNPSDNGGVLVVSGSEQIKLPRLTGRNSIKTTRLPQTLGRDFENSANYDFLRKKAIYKMSDLIQNETDKEKWVNLLITSAKNNYGNISISLNNRNGRRISTKYLKLPKVFVSKLLQEEIKGNKEKMKRFFDVYFRDLSIELSFDAATYDDGRSSDLNSIVFSGATFKTDFQIPSNEKITRKYDEQVVQWISELKELETNRTLIQTNGSSSVPIIQRQSGSRDRYRLNLISDTGGDLNTINDGTLFQSNREKLDKLFQSLNTIQAKIKSNLSIQNDDDILEVVYKTIPNKNDLIDIYLRSKTNNEYEFPIYRMMSINFIASTAALDQGMNERINIEYGRWVDFESGTTELVADTPVRVPNDKPIGTKGKDVYLGKWEVHTPLKISFIGKPTENEVLVINGKKIDVLNQRFNEILTDNRTSADDNERVFNEGVSTTDSDGNEVTKTEENSHPKNQYTIEVYEYNNNGKGNLESDLVKKYTKILVINSRAIQEDFKWYAWKPEENFHQRILIEPFLIDEQGNVIKDENGNSIPNPKYDSSIDPKTGTKKQVLWLNLSGFSTLQDFLDIWKTNPGNQIENIPARARWSDDEDNYYYKTFLPQDTKTLLVPFTEINDEVGIPVEAVVLGKGGLRQFVGNISNAKIFKISVGDQSLDRMLEAKADYLAYLGSPINLTTVSGDSSYFSDEGLYLFAISGEKTISQYKLVYVTPNTSPQTLFADVIHNTNLTPFWKTSIGAQVYNFIIDRFHLKEQDIYNLSYENLNEYYKLFMDAIWRNHKFDNKINASLRLKDRFGRLTEKEFKRNFFNLETSKWNFDDIKEYYFVKNNSYKIIDVENVEFIHTIEGVESDSDVEHDTVKLTLVLNSYNINHKLTTNTIYIPLSKLDSNGIQIYTANWNEDYFTSVAKQTRTYDEFIEQINSNRNNWFIEPSEEFLNSIQSGDIEVNLSRLNDTLTIHLIPSNTWIRIFPTTIFRFDVSSFWRQQNSRNHKNTKNIFDGIKPFEIHIPGIKDNDDYVEDAITEELEKHLENIPNPLRLDEDYEISNIEEVLKQLREPEYILSEKFKPTNKAYLILTAKSPNIGVLQIPVFNWTKTLIKDKIDLSTITIPPIKIENSDEATMRNAIYTHINNEFSSRNLGISIPKDVLLRNDINLQISILKRKTKVKLTVIPNRNGQIVGETSFNVETDFDATKLVRIPLNLIKDWTTTKFNENILSILRQKVVDKAVKFLRDEYQLDFLLDYNIDFKDLNEIIRGISISDNLERFGAIRILGDNRTTEGTKELPFSNQTDKQITDDLDTTDLVVDGIKIRNLALIPDWETRDYTENRISIIETKIINSAISYMTDNNYVFGIDYLIDNQELRNTLRNISKNDGLKHEGVITLISVFGKTIGKKQLKFTNTISSELNVIDDLKEPVDLSIIPDWENANYSENSKQELRNKLIQAITTYLEKHNLTLFKDYKFNANEINQVINEVMISDNQIHNGTITIYPIQGKSINTKSFTFTNQTDKQIIDDLDETIDYGNSLKKATLSAINGDLFVFRENDKERIKRLFLERLSSHIKNIYKLDLNVHYEVDDTQLNNAIEAIAIPDDLVHTSRVILHSKDNKADENGYVLIANKTSIPFINKNNITSTETNREKEAFKKAVSYFLIPVGILSFISLALLGWFVYMKKYKNKVQ